MKSFTVNDSSDATRLGRMTRDKQTFHIDGADCGPDCKCGRHASRNQERRRLVSDADLRGMLIKDLLKLRAPGIASTDAEQLLALRATNELHRRFWATK